MTKYEVIWNESDEWGEYTCSTVFEGSWDDLQAYIKRLRNADCYHIDANAFSWDEEGGDF